MMERIESLTNAKVKKWMKLHTKKGRDESKTFLIEGEHLIQEALSAGVVETIITDAEDLFHFPATVFVNEAVMNKLSENVSAVHYIAVCKMPENVVKEHKRVLILDGIQDPGNMGTLVRTAISFSFDAVYCSKQTCDLYNDKTIRSTQGALFHIPVIRCDLPGLVKKLQAEGVTVVATTLEDALPLSELKGTESMAFILGNEGQGVSSELQKSADVRLRIEMNGFESLNVAIAGGIIMYQYRKK